MLIGPQTVIDRREIWKRSESQTQRLFRFIQKKPVSIIGAF